MALLPSLKYRITSHHLFQLSSKKKHKFGKIAQKSSHRARGAWIRASFYSHWPLSDGVILCFSHMGIGLLPSFCFFFHFIPLQAFYRWMRALLPFSFRSPFIYIYILIHIVYGACFLSLAFDTTCASRIIHRISLGLLGLLPSLAYPHN
jgi:hypothetical protein